MPHCWRAFGPRRSRAIRGFNLDTAHFPATSAALLAMRAEVLRGERSVLGPALDLKCRILPPINFAPPSASQCAFHPSQKPFRVPCRLLPHGWEQTPLHGERGRARLSLASQDPILRWHFAGPSHPRIGSWTVHPSQGQVAFLAILGGLRRGPPLGHP